MKKPGLIEKAKQHERAISESRHPSADGTAFYYHVPGAKLWDREDLI